MILAFMEDLYVLCSQSEWNLQNRFTGWVDVPLTAAGGQVTHLLSPNWDF